MIAGFSEYIKQIILFMVFASFVALVLPHEKYRGYINIVMGFVVMFLVFEPIYRGVSGGAEDIISRIDAQLSYGDTELYVQKRQALIEESVTAQIHLQTERLAEEYGYELQRLAMDISPETGELTRLELYLWEPLLRQEKIEIAPVTIGQEDQDPAGAAAVKKLISDFYNLPEEHIYVTVQGATG